MLAERRAPSAARNERLDEKRGALSMHRLLMLTLRRN